MPKVKRIDHVAIVIDDVDAAAAFWQDALGLSITKVEEEPAEKTVVAFLPVGDGEIELVKPTDKESGTARFLEKRGPGMHHICLEVEGLDDMVAHLKAQGVQLITESPAQKPDGTRYIFIHPKSAQGVLVELYEKP
ncbi:MAG: methylmalonyl-CoA epimerase [Chloroflexi bacterium]|nr:methylmalonyl-CoA epimerase [Chloroflexota bacterium]